MHARTWLSFVLFYITYACATVPNATVEQQLNARQETIFYGGFCGVELRASTNAVHRECNKADVRVLLQNDRYVRISNEANNPAPPDTECDHYMELQIVNSVAMVPTDDAPLPTNGACAAINAMLNTMADEFPLGGPTYAKYKTSFIKASPLFTRTNERPNTYWVNREINRLKGRMVRKFLTENQPFARSNLTDREVKVVLPALKSYIRNRGDRSFVEGLASDLHGAWQNLIDDVDAEMVTLINRRWSGNLAKHNKKIDQLNAGKAKFEPDEANLLDRFDAAVAFILNHPFAV